MARRPLKTIPISSLIVGMYVTKLDIPWIESPFIAHSRLIKSSKDIVALKKAGAKKLVIDPNRGVDTPKETAEEISDETPQKTQQETPPEKTGQTPAEPPPEKQNFSERPMSAEQKRDALFHEIDRAKEIREHVRQAVSEALKDLGNGHAIDVGTLNPIVDETLASIERNDQAMLNIVHMSRRTQKLADHTFSTFCLALNLGRQLKLPNDEVEALGLAALLHEAGWSQIPLQLMEKRTEYTSNEKKLVKKHVEIGEKVLTQCNLSEKAMRIIAEHHERCDGSGYPRQLSDEQLSNLSKIFGVVDSYDELVHQLNDKTGMLPTNALRTLYKDAKASIYDQKAVAAMISLLGVYPISSAVKLSNGSLGIVREVPKESPLKPLVEIFIDENQEPLSKPIFLDLGSDWAAENNLSIDSVVDPSDNKNPKYKRLILDA